MTAIGAVAQVVDGRASTLIVESTAAAAMAFASPLPSPTNEGETMRLEYEEDHPKCCVEGCQFKICIALSSPYCFKHTPGDEDEKHRQIDRYHEQGRDSDMEDKTA